MQYITWVFMDNGGAGLHSWRSAEGGAEVLICEGIVRCTQPKSRALPVSPRYFPKEQTPLIEGGLFHLDKILGTPRLRKVRRNVR